MLISWQNLVPIFSYILHTLEEVFFFADVVADKETKKEKFKKVGKEFYAFFVVILTLAAAIVPLYVTLKPTTEETTPSSINSLGKNFNV